MTLSPAFKKIAAALLITASLASAGTPAFARGNGGGDGTDRDPGCSGGCGPTPTQNNGSEHTQERPQDQCYLDLKNPTILSDGRVIADIYLLRSHATRQRVNEAFNNQHGELRLLLDIDDKKAVFASQQAFTDFEAAHTFNGGFLGLGDKKIIPQELGGIGEHSLSDKQLWQTLCPSALHKLATQPGVQLLLPAAIKGTAAQRTQFVPVAQ